MTAMHLFPWAIYYRSENGSDYHLLRRFVSQRDARRTLRVLLNLVPDADLALGKGNANIATSKIQSL